MICKIWKQFVNTLTAEDKYSLLNRDNLTQPIDMQLSHKQKTFSWIGFEFFKFALSLEHFKQKDDPLRWPFEKQHSKRLQTLLKSERQCLYHICWWLRGQLRREKSPLVIRKILKLVVNTFIAHEKYSLLNRDNLTQQIHIQFSQKQKTFPALSFAFLKSMLNLQHFQQKDDPHSWCISEIMDSEKRS